MGELVAQLHALGVHTDEANGLFELLDDDDSGEVDVDEFVSGILRLKGAAKAVDMATLLYENKKIFRKINKLYSKIASPRRVVPAAAPPVSPPLSPPTLGPTVRKGSADLDFKMRDI